MEKNDRQLFKDWVMENTNLFELLRIITMNLKTYYLAMFSDKKYLSYYDYEVMGKVMRVFVGEAKRKKATRFKTRVELKEALKNYINTSTETKPNKVIVLEELVIQN